MRFCRIFKSIVVALSLVHVILPAPRLFAGDNAPQNSSLRLSDVALGDQGRLAGMVVNGEGQLLANVAVTVKQNGREVGQVKSNAQGQFQIDGVRGGLCQVETSETLSVYRCWTAKAAPPSAAPEVLVVSDTRVARGQRPLGEIFTNPLLIGLIFAAAVAIPLAVHNSRATPSGS